MPPIEALVGNEIPSKYESLVSSTPRAEILRFLSRFLLVPLVTSPMESVTKSPDPAFDPLLKLVFVLQGNVLTFF